jgi:hypothetical protein
MYVELPGVVALELQYVARNDLEAQRTRRLLARYQLHWPSIRDGERALRLAPMLRQTGMGVPDRCRDCRSFARTSDSP